MFPSGQKLLTTLSGAIQFLITSSGPQSIALPGKFGSFTLTEDTPLDVADASVTAASMIVIGLLTPGGTVGALPVVQTKTAGTGFNITGTSGDTSDYTYLILG